jgi:aminopeptidase N
MRHGDDYPDGTPARGVAGYSKPAVTLHALRGLIGEDTFRPTYKEYARRWAFKHPQPYDLFNTFEDELGQDLDWFWTAMLYETWTLDQAIADVDQSGERVVVTVEDKGLAPMPATLRVTYDTGKTAEQVIPVDVWLNGERQATASFEPGTVIRVEIDPETFFPDVDRSNNVWGN